ncbi:MAG TPA: nucleoside-diphosphate sugar epimerase/dehydratase, partial [Candidatus Obscuribacterales bacterium]
MITKTLESLVIRNFLSGFRLVYSTFSRNQKSWVLMICDGLLVVIAIYLSLMLRFEQFQISQYEQYAGAIILLIGIKLLFFKCFKLYQSILTGTGAQFLFTVLQAVVCSSSTLIILMYFLGSRQLPRSVLLIDAVLTLVLLASWRLFIRKIVRSLYAWSKHKNHQQRVIIYGVGEAGLQLAQSLEDNPEYKLIGFSDDNPSMHHMLIYGLPVYPPDKLSALQLKKSFDLILLALPEVSSQTRRTIFKQLQLLKVPIHTIPSISEIISSNISVNTVRPINISDLLGREQVKPRLELLQQDITGKSVLVTGAGGSIGSELCRQIVQHSPKCLVLYELNEFALYTVDLDLAESYPHVPRIACLGSVLNEAHFHWILTHHQIDTIYHAAAYKHVPMVEANPAQGVLNNILGTLNVVTCAISCDVKKFVLISTDKAVRPTNVMGATKRTAELVLQALANQPETGTCLTMVRFGNVLNSSGSVVPRFQKQITDGKTITLTHPDITRYFMSIPEAASLVIQAGAMSQGGEVFLLEMGEPVRIYDLAVHMIELSGLKPYDDIEIEITGLRPGEKIYEELLIDCSQ